MTVGTMLDPIVAASRKRLGERKDAVSLSEVMRRAAAGRPKDLGLSLQGPGIHVIAEIKRASPSKGAFGWRLGLEDLARSYVRGGAAAVSVLTEQDFFKGSLDDLAVVRRTADLPVLRKDFITDIYQVFEARAAGADAVLLIAAILDEPLLRVLCMAASHLGLSSLVEVHDKRDLDKALSVPAAIIGINNRDLSDFSVDLETTFRLRPLIPAGITVVSESGIHSAADVARLHAAGVHAVLVGEALVTSADPAGDIQKLLSGGRCTRTVDTLGM